MSSWSESVGIGHDCVVKVVAGSRSDLLKPDTFYQYVDLVVCKFPLSFLCTCPVETSITRQNGLSTFWSWKCISSLRFANSTFVMNSRHNLKAISPSKSSKLASYCPLSFFQLLYYSKKPYFVLQKPQKLNFQTDHQKRVYFYIFRQKFWLFSYNNKRQVKCYGNR